MRYGKLHRQHKKSAKRNTQPAFTRFSYSLNDNGVVERINLCRGRTLLAGVAEAGRRPSETHTHTPHRHNHNERRRRTAPHRTDSRSRLKYFREINSFVFGAIGMFAGARAVVSGLEPRGAERAVRQPRYLYYGAGALPERVHVRASVQADNRVI